VKKHTYKFIDLFAGIGGFHCALNQTSRAECVFSSEWDTHARATYAHNFQVALRNDLRTSHLPPLAGDITKVPPQDIPDFDILCGGFPCQPFSNAGFKRGFNDTRGTLFFNIEEILRAKRPRAFFLENVRGLVSHDGGRTLATITQALLALGYVGPAGAKTFHHLVKASDYGTPQNRPRVFLVGFLQPEAAARFVAPARSEFTQSLAQIMGGRVTMNKTSDKARTIGFTLRCGGKGSGVADRRNWDSYLVDGVEKRITIAQAMRLQGFPETFSFPKSVSKTQAMKQLGNSVAVPAIQAWATAIIAALDSAEA
jgi:DNA (cytosine-5)-methyltransferase 1